MGAPSQGQRPPVGTTFVSSVMRGTLLGVGASIAQVLVSQIVGLATGRRSRADVAPRLMRGAAARLGASPSRPLRWTLAVAFHFGYAAGWGALFTLARGTGRGCRLPTWLAGVSLGGVLYAFAFSRVGAGTLVGSELHPDRREGRELAIEWASALGFALPLAYLERRSREER